MPPEALREVVLNAVMHRDYSQPGSYVAIAVFDDRLEIRSTGALPGGVTAEALSGSHQSVLRNPLIAAAFHRTGAVVKSGAAAQIASSRPASSTGSNRPGARYLHHSNVLRELHNSRHQ